MVQRRFMARHAAVRRAFVQAPVRLALMRAMSGGEAVARHIFVRAREHLRVGADDLLRYTFVPSITPRAGPCFVKARGIRKTDAPLEGLHAAVHRPS